MSRFDDVADEAARLDLDRAVPARLKGSRYLCGHCQRGELPHVYGVDGATVSLDGWHFEGRVLERGGGRRTRVRRGRDPRARREQYVPLPVLARCPRCQVVNALKQSSVG